MKHIEVVKACEVEVGPFLLSDFTQSADSEPREKSISKKAVKRLAKKAGLSYTDDQIYFAKKIIEAYLGQR